MRSHLSRQNSHPNIHLCLCLRTTKQWTENKVESFMRDIIIYTSWDLSDDPDQHHTERIKELLHNLKDAARLWYQDEYQTAITRVIKTIDNYTFYNIWDRLNIEDRCFALPIYKLAGMRTDKTIWIPDSSMTSYRIQSGKIWFQYGINPSYTTITT